MKILVLIIYHRNEYYDQMLEIQQSYIHGNENVDAFFVSFNEHLTEDLQVVDDMIYIKGRESHINILKKSVLAVQYLVHTMNKQYDFLVRGNISTIIHLSNLRDFLHHMPRSNFYSGATLETLLWELEKYEISEDKQHDCNKYYGLKYFQGTSIILSMDLFARITENEIDYDIVDDVKVGLLIQKYAPEVYELVSCIEKPHINFGTCDDKTVFIRNANYRNRMLDIQNMRFLVNSIHPVTNSPSFTKTIYLTYKSVHCLEQIKEQWLTLNPEYQVELFDDNRCLYFLRSNFGEKYCDIFDYIQDGAIKCDFFRLCVLYIYGGVYVDADVKPVVPLQDFVKDDIDFVTCISYNWSSSTCTFNYNPHFMVSKRYNQELFKTIKRYENAFDSKQPYSYWGWSICTMFNLELSEEIGCVECPFNVTKGNKKYQFLIEKVSSNNIIYDYRNIRDTNGEMKITSGNNMYCEYDGKVVLYNFLNKGLLINS